jgi:putative FmdB family regulatory protein
MSPRYDYVCPKCGDKETRMVPMTVYDEQRCVICGTRMAVVMHPVGLSAHRNTEGKGRSA